MTLSDQFRTWADAQRKTDPRADLARQVANALGDREASKLWSQMNLREEFASRRPDQTGWSGVRQVVSSAVYLLPVLVAWLHLSGAFSAYATAVRRAGGENQINFLAFWTGAYDGEPWVRSHGSASSAAGWVIFSFLILILVQVGIAVLEGRDEASEVKLKGYVLQASLEFAKNRAVTPEELSSGITQAAVSLGEGLENLRQAFDDTTALVAEVQGVTGTITESATALRDATDSLSEVMKPLTNFGTTADSAAAALASTVSAVDKARVAFEESALAGASTLSGAGSTMSTQLSENVRILGALRDAVDAVAMSVTTSAEGLRGVVNNSGTAANQAASLVAGLSGLSTDIASAAQSLGMVAKTLVEANRAVGEIAASANSPEVESYIVGVRNHAEAMVDAARAVEEAVRDLGQNMGGWGRGQG